MYGETLLVANIGVVVYHRQTDELIAPLSNDSATTGDNNLGEVVVQWYAVAVEGHRRVAVGNEGG